MGISEMYWKPCQTSKMERFARIVNVWKQPFLKTPDPSCLTGF